MPDALWPAMALGASCLVLAASIVTLLATVRAPALEDEERQFLSPLPLAPEDAEVTR